MNLPSGNNNPWIPKGVLISVCILFFFLFVAPSFPSPVLSTLNKSPRRLNHHQEEKSPSSFEEDSIDRTGDRAKVSSSPSRNIGEKFGSGEGIQHVEEVETPQKLLAVNSPAPVSPEEKAIFFSGERNPDDILKASISQQSHGGKRGAKCSRKMLWFVSIAWQGKSKASFAKHAIVSLRSMHVNAQGGLVPIWLLYADGSLDSLMSTDSEFREIKFLVEVAGGIIRLKPVKESYPFRFLDFGRDPELTLARAGALGRLEALHILHDELPEIYPKSLLRNNIIDKTKILYTDTDVIFMPNFNHCSWPKPAFISLGSELHRNEGPINAGVVMINSETITPQIMDEVVQKGAMREPPFPNLDQGTLHEYFPEGSTGDGGSSSSPYREQYPDRFNYKCQWGKGKKQKRSTGGGANAKKTVIEVEEDEPPQIVHFWGPKPGKGGGLNCSKTLPRTADPEDKRKACGLPSIARVRDFERIWALGKSIDGHRFCSEMEEIWTQYAEMPSMKIPSSRPPLG